MRGTAAPVLEGGSCGVLAALDVTALQERIYRTGLAASCLRWGPFAFALILGMRRGIAASVAADAPIAREPWYLPILGTAPIEVPAALFCWGLLGLATGITLSGVFRWLGARRLRPGLAELDAADRARVLKPICNVGGDTGRLVDRLVADLRLDRYRLEVAPSEAPDGRGDELAAWGRERTA
jgi:hypothetical protein